jgi:hypothetical protein
VGCSGADGVVAPIITVLRDPKTIPVDFDFRSAEGYLARPLAQKHVVGGGVLGPLNSLAGKVVKRIQSQQDGRRSRALSEKARHYERSVFGADQALRKRPQKLDAEAEKLKKKMYDPGAVWLSSLEISPFLAKGPLLPLSKH